MNNILAYFLTWTTYGTWLPGDERNWVDRHHLSTTPAIQPPNPQLQAYARTMLKEEPVILSHTMRNTVRDALLGCCKNYSWHIHALAVCSNHIHIVLTAPDVQPSKAMGILKVSATKSLNHLRTAPTRKHWWTRSGNKRVLPSPHDLDAAIQYVDNQHLTSPRHRLGAIE